MSKGLHKGKGMAAIPKNSTGWVGGQFEQPFYGPGQTWTWAVLHLA